MKKRRFLIGPGAPSLMLVVVVVSMSVLGLLALMSEKNDLRLAERTEMFTQAQYEAMARAERSLSALDAVLVQSAKVSHSQEAYLALVEKTLPKGMALSGGCVVWQEEMIEGGALRCAVRILPLGEQARYVWQEHVFASAHEEEIW